MRLIRFSLLALIKFYEAPACAGALDLRSLDAAPVLHFTLTRRGGKFAPTEAIVDHVDINYLSETLAKTEARFNFTQRQVEGNKLVRKAKDANSARKDEGSLMGEVAEEGIW